MKQNTLKPLVVKSLGQGKYADGQGLWLIKRDKISGQWVLRLARNGRRREMGLGRWPDVSVAEAREKAFEARRQWRLGVDPIQERLSILRTAPAMTVKEAILSCFEARKAQLKRDGEAGKWLSPMSNYVIPHIGEVAITELNQHVIKDVLSSIWHSRTDAAVKSLNRINLTLKHAVALGLDVDIQAAAKARELLGKQRHVVQHIASMSYAEVPAFYRSLKDMPGITALALRFLILTVARNSEVRLASFDEISGGVWTLAPERTKGNREHRVPLCGEALAIIDTARTMSPNGYLFPSYHGKPLSDVAMSKFMKDRDLAARPHGFRASFRTWCEECTNAAFETKESALGHYVDSEVVGAYQRSDRLKARSVLMREWESFLLR